MKKIVTIMLMLAIIGVAIVGAQEMRVYNDGKIDYVPNNVKIRLFAEDMGSSLKYIEYSLDGSRIQKYEGPIQLSNEGRHVIAYRAVDQLGNISTEKVYSCIVDDTPPYFTASANGPAFIENGMAYGTGNTSIVLWAEDELVGVSAIFVSVDDTGFRQYTGPGFIEEEGRHVGKAYAVDKVGNRTKTYAVEGYIDNSPPTVRIIAEDSFVELQGSKYATANNKYSVKAYDNVSGVKEAMVSIDRGEFFSYTEPFTVQAEGFHTIRAKAVDYLNNESKAVELGFYIDVDTPEASLEITID